MSCSTSQTKQLTFVEKDLQSCVNRYLSLPVRCIGMLQVYSFGVTVWQIMERKRPFEGLEPYQVSTSHRLGCACVLCATTPELYHNVPVLTMCFLKGSHALVLCLLCCDVSQHRKPNAGATCLHTADMWFQHCQVSAQWIMGTDVQLPPVTIPEDATDESRRVLHSLGAMVQNCTQFDAEK